MLRRTQCEVSHGFCFFFCFFQYSVQISPCRAAQLGQDSRAYTQSTEAITYLTGEYLQVPHEEFRDRDCRGNEGVLMKSFLSPSLKPRTK